MLPLKDNVPTRTVPFVTIGLIAVNFLVWFWELSHPGVDVHVFRDGFYPCALHGPCHLPTGFHHLPWYEGVFTGMFMHASWEHILGNMLFFWIFGNNVEDALGHVGFLAWYLVAGIAAIALQLWSGGLTFLQPQSGGGTAFFAHIGGFLFGLATGLALLAARGRPRVPP